MNLASRYELIFYSRSDASSTKLESRVHVHASLYSTVLEPSMRPTCLGAVLLVAVISKPSEAKHRETYRNTVLSPVTARCQSMSDTKHLFVLGLSNNREMQRRLEKENGLHGDILQGNFSDTYDNLTIKSLFFLRWVSKNCESHLKYVLKIDDDVFTVLPDTRDYLMHNTKLNDYTIAGSVFPNSPPNRDPYHKWYAGKYEGNRFPKYVSGTAYALPYALIKPLLDAAFKIPFLKLEDVFVTGLAAHATNLSIDYHQFPGFNPQRINRGQNIAKVNFSTPQFLHGLDTEQLAYAYSTLQKKRPINCT